ncbi:MAG: cyclopropane fatty acyl phospholipid synthase [Chitinophaga sp.]|uniref:cyclopropane fatty acyl phospholipid synthase n=1 Tax=Chitinophaga sp. TaxID=1869181 RepID=UPI0025C73CFA|nr:cyclopropane fatty acyl phospholipid synthase [Chitinophaga sp.]MBV8253061.1 cyclopropane fatty acyl phospholipid synthase [Chitinophaga sp.]
MERSKNMVTKLLDSAGVHVNGNQPWDITVHNDHFYPGVLKHGSLALGEAYMAGWWDSPNPDEMICRILSAKLEDKIRASWQLKKDILLSRIFNFQHPEQSFKNGRKHYDLGNDLFEIMLDKRMTYTCGFWENATSLDEAQENKLDLSCRKLHLKPGMKVLDIGCGWGSFARFAAERYGAHVTGITVSREQAELAKARCVGLPVNIRVMDYRSLNEKFDAIASLGMFEHVGYRNYHAYMQVARQSLEDGGLFLLHTIGGNKSHSMADPWLDKYIFPHANIPSIAQIGKAMEDFFIMEHWENFSTDYDKTLMAWYHNVNDKWDELANAYDVVFHRMWNYYLLSCAGSFRARDSQLWQVVLSPNGVRGGYKIAAD